MILLPAIDLMDGQVVRLTKGDYNRKIVYGDDPAAFAREWVAKGAEMLHLVDLDGAKAGRPINREAIRAITREAEAPVEIGGGIRTLETVAEYFDLGVSYVILGTAAIENPDFVLRAADLYPERIIVGIDVKEGKPATRGWLETVDENPVALADRFAAMGAAGIVYTDISRDGMLEGANIEGLRKFAAAIDLPVTASGGISTIADIVALKEIEKVGISSAIIGKALYDGAIGLTEALAAARGEQER